MPNRTLFRYQCAANQERFIVASLSTKANYHLPVSYRLRGTVDVNRLKDCIHDVVKSDDALNVSFVRDRDGRFFCERKHQSVAQIRHEKTHGASLANHTKDLEKFIFGDQSPLEQSPCKFYVLENGTAEIILTLSLHHAVADGVSIGLFIERLTERYNRHANIDNLGEALPTYPDLIAKYHLRSGEWSPAEKTFWIQSFSGIAEPGVLPADRTDDETPERASVSSIIDQGAYARICRAADELCATPFNFVYAAYLIVLSRHTGSQQVLSTFQSSGRYKKPDTWKTIGQFSNALAYLADLSNSRSFSEFCHGLKNDVRARVSHERFPYHEVIRETKHHPTFGINWYPRYQDLNLRETRCDPLTLLEWQSDYTLNLHCLNRDEGLELRISYPKSRFDSSRIRLLLEQLCHLVSAFAANPALRVGAARLTTFSDQQLPSLETSWPRQRLPEGIYERFAVSAARHSRLPALHYRGEFVTYGELQSKIESLSRFLVQNKVPPGSRIAISAYRCSGLVIAMLAILKVRASFAVFDRDYPTERIRQFRHIFDPDAIVILGDILDDERQGSDPFSQVLAPDCYFISDRGEYRSHKSSDGERATRLRSSGSAAYFLFTSGTTGKPKCVEHPHDPLLNFVEWHTAEHAFTSSTRFAMTSGLGHDPIMRDIFTPLFNGACCYIPPADFTLNPRMFWQWLQKHAISVLHATPQITKLVALGRPTGETLSAMTHVFWGGDSLTKSAASEFLRIAPRATGVNFYGATETPQAVAAFRIDPASAYSYIPIGKGVAGAQVLVLRQYNGEPAGFGEIGQVAVRSHYLSAGYTEKTENDAAFLRPIRDGQPEPECAYLTGDFGYYLSDGNIRFLGRKDNQIKIRGYRVETKEIESFLDSIDCISRAVVVPFKTGDDESTLAAYFTRAQGTFPNVENVRERLQAHFPSYMVPGFLVEISEFPLTPNGKVDYPKLPEPSVEDAALARGEFVAPRNRVERDIVDVLEKLLGIKGISVNNTFSGLGADSLSFVMASMELERIVGALPTQWETLTLRDLAATRGEKTAFATVETAVLIRAIAICAVVAGHFGVIHFSGAVYALFLVAGFSFGRFQIGALETSGSMLSSYKMILKIAIPTILYTILVQVVFHKIDLSSILLVSNFVDPEAASGFNYWFVMVLIQNLAILTLTISTRSVRDFTRRNPFLAGVITLGIAYSLSWVGPLVWNTEHLYNRVPHMTLWWMALGWCVAQSSTIRDRLMVATVTASLILLETWRFGHVGLTALLALILIVSVHRVWVPRPANRVINLVAASSLFIYLTHFQAGSLMDKLGFLGIPSLRAAGALVVGVTCYLAWGWLQSSSVARMFRDVAGGLLRMPLRYVKSQKVG